MKKLLTFLTLLTLSIGVTWAEDETINFSDLYSNDTDIDGVTISGDDFSLVFNKSNGTTAPKYYKNGTAVRWYGGNTLTVSSETKTISKIDITYTRHDNGVTASVGSYSDTSGSGKGKWTGSANRVVFTQSGSSGHDRISAISVTYEGGTTVETVATPTFSPEAGTYSEAQNVTISCATSGATIRYTLDGTNPTATTGTVYTSPISVTSTTTIKAIATATGYDPSSVATATYTIVTPETVTIPYEESFAGTFGYFYKKDVTGANIWVTNSGYAKASGYISGSNTASESWLISPYIDLTGASTPELSFSHAGNYFNGNMQSDVAVKVKKQGDATWSDLTVNTWPNGTSWTFVDNTTSLADYAGKTIQIAFVYTSSTSRAGTWEVKNLAVVDTSAPDYYLYGTFNNWNTQDANYKFNLNNGTYSLTGADLPDGVRFKIAKVVNDQVTEIGASNGGSDYGINGGWHNNIPMNGADAYTIESGALTNITLNTTNMTFDVSRDAQFFVKGDFNGWNREAMTATATGWTIEHVISSANQFGFVDEWGYWYGGRDWWINEEHLDTELEIKPDGNFYMNIDGTDDYTLTVNSAKTTLTVSKIEVPTGDEYVLVTDVDDLDVNSIYILFSKGSDNQEGYAMAAYNNGNNYPQTSASAVVANGKITAPDGAQVITLESTTATVNNETVNAWYINTGGGYAYAASNSSNHLKQSATANDNCKATIEIIDNAAVITFRGSYSHNLLRYNSGNSLFSCYLTGQSPVYLYKKVEAVERATPPVITPASQNVKGGLLEGVMITAAEGATIHYTLDGSEPTVDSPVFDGQAFNITGTGGERKMVRAIAVEADKAPSYPASVTYTFQAPATPTISPDAGTYNEAVTVTITSTDGGTIYYLVDPEEAPTNATGVITAGQVYTEGETTITLSENGTHKVYAAVDLNGITSWAQATYTIILPTPTQVTLAELCQNGVITEGENWYVISDKLIAVYADEVKGILWCKDMGNASIFSTSIKDGQVDFLKDDPQAQNGRDWDQSNWIALHFTTPTATNNIDQLVHGAVNRYIKPGTVKGKLIDEVNYALRMDLDQLELVTQADDPDINPNYIPNVYCPANFMPTNLNIWGNDEDGGYTTGSDQNYFFMNPKIQEICEVTYAQWDAINGYFTVPTASGFDGAFYIGTGYNVIQSQNFTSSLQDEHIYRFKAIVQRSDKDNYGPKNVTTPATGITLYPVDLDPVSSEIPTAINTINVNGEVKSVKYVNVAGMVSDVPFQGVNIVVTEYTDGSRTTTKMLKK